MIPRLIQAPEGKSFFLFGPRGTGKSTWLKAVYPDSAVLDLLNEAQYQEFLRDPAHFRLYRLQT